MGTIKIGSSSNRKGVTINPKTVLFNDKNVVYIKNGLTEIWSNLKSLVPILTSNKGSDGGECFSSTEHSTYVKWKAFDGSTDVSNFWQGTNGVANGYIGYKFKVPTCVKKFSLTNRNLPDNPNGVHAPKTIALMGSNDNSVWENISGELTNNNGSCVTTEFNVDNRKCYLYYKVEIFNSYTNTVAIGELQFYGSQLVGLVPTLTDNTNVIYSYNHNTYKPYMAFDLTNTSNKKYNSDYHTDCTSEYIGYNFNKQVIVKYISLGGSTNNNTTDCNFDLEGSNNGTTWTKIASIIAKKNTAELFNVNNNVPYSQIRLRCTSEQGTFPNGSGKYLISIMGLQFFG